MNKYTSKEFSDILRRVGQFKEQITSECMKTVCFKVLCGLTAIIGLSLSLVCYFINHELAAK